MADRHPDDTDQGLPPQPELAPCPFCGDTPTLLPGMRYGFFVTCESHTCHVRPQSTFPTDTIEQAAEHWNQRPVAQPA